MKLKSLSIFTGILFVLSLIVYANENKRGTDLLAGSEFIKGINVNSVEKIQISTGKDKKVTFVKEGDRFVLESHYSFPASNEKVNNLIYAISSITVAEKVEGNASESDLEKYELGEAKSNLRVEFFDQNDRSSLAFRLGKNHPKRGTYLLKEGGSDIYLSQKNVWINKSHKDFIEKLLLRVPSHEVAEIVLNNEEDNKILKGEKDFKLANNAEKELKQAVLEKMVRSLNNLRMRDFYPRDDSQVNMLIYKNSLKVKLKNQVTYRIALAMKQDKHYMALSADTAQMPKQVTVSQQDGKEELQKIEDLIKTQANLQQFNVDKGNWVFEIDPETYRNLAKEFKDLI